jgi:hypothetical protein
MARQEAVQMSSMSVKTLQSIVDLPPIWMEWDEDQLFYALSPNDCEVLQLLLHKKIHRLTDFYEHQMALAAKMMKEEREKQKT